MTITERRTQDQRSAKTRRLLLQATIESLMDVGYANTSTAGIAKRAGVSRGAQTHHYPGKMDLIVAATEEMFANFANALEALATELRAGRLSYDAFFDAVWDGVRHGDWFYSSLEIIVAARGDEELRRHLAPLILDLHERFEGTWSRSFVAVDADVVSSRVALNLVMNVFRGMAVQAVLRRDDAYFHEMLGALKAIIAVHVRPVKSG
ncbi:TetR/AcrR family transcriptional regulator [Pseudooceanicola marinus]|uniref:TetR/AcrR family transcriptional regulator n=1 Tax=Pseudooceanicola marinus TaxID=396013 RepID=UPI001C98B0C6|nr:TetR/AcrR family transcriptional regulator [Pseudooceanicola marinus]MBY5971564.1 TetR/AcrR family transcriptional regulator [Ferrimonas balearica]MCA1335941.1 TetR/AcrR family transcriptional regulator [Pseudooceanicola marinus]